MKTIRFLALVMSVGLTSAPSLLAQSAPKTQEAPEHWTFDFDSRPWQLGYQNASAPMFLREYVLPTETVENWNELVTSVFVARENVAVKDVFENVKNALFKDCPNAILKVVEQSATNILFEWSHKGCGIFPPQHEVKRISRVSSGILFLSYTVKSTEFPEEKRKAWLAILAKATPAVGSGQPTPVSLEGVGKVPGVSLVNEAAVLRKDALDHLGSFAKKEYGCDSVTVLGTQHERDEGKVFTNGQGRLLSGLVEERWSVDVCGKPKDLLLVFRADGQGGSEINISEVKK
jgi:hypothetical protein